MDCPFRLPRRSEKGLHGADSNKCTARTPRTEESGRECAAEMVVYDAGAREIRMRYAGFFDPGFGRGDGSVLGTKVVMEVRAREAWGVPRCGSSGSGATPTASTAWGSGPRTSTRRSA